MARVLALLVFLVASAAQADSSWYRINSTTGAADANVSVSAEAGWTYTTTIDAGAQSVVIGAAGCNHWKVIARLADTTFDVVGCTDATCGDPTVLPSGALSTGGYAYDYAAHPFLRIDNATSTDVARLYCGK